MPYTTSRLRPIVATLLDPAERGRVDAVTEGRVEMIHARTVHETVQMVRERPVSGVIISAKRVTPRNASGLSRLCRNFPGIATVALVSQHDQHSSEQLLKLGNDGVRTMVDLTRREGVERLRDLFADASSPIGTRIMRRLGPELSAASEPARRFFEILVWYAPTTASVRELARKLDISPSTVMSRFYRAGLPSPKKYLGHVRLVYAAAFFESRGLSVADVAHRLEFSSAQSFSRNIRLNTAMNATRFRMHMTFDAMMHSFLERMIRPYHTIYGRFPPL